MINLLSMGPGLDRSHSLDLQSPLHLLPDTLPTALRAPFYTCVIEFITLLYTSYS